MATQFFDIDGTLVIYHTNKWINGAKESIINYYRNGDKIILITMRGPQDLNEEWSIDRTKETILKELDELGINYIIIFDVDSPRVLHDDSVCFLDKRITNQEWI